MQLPWSSFVTELKAMAHKELGNRARKVDEILDAADPTPTGIEAAIDEIAGIALLFIDQSRLEQLAQRMKVRLQAQIRPDA